MFKANFAIINDHFSHIAGHFIDIYHKICPARQKRRHRRNCSLRQIHWALEDGELREYLEDQSQLRLIDTAAMFRDCFTKDMLTGTLRYAITDEELNVTATDHSIIAKTMTEKLQISVTCETTSAFPQ